MKKMIQAMIGMAVCLGAMASFAWAVDPAVQAKIDEKKAIVASWGKDPALVAAVKELTATPPAAAKGMTQGEWEKLTILDPKVKEFQSNKVGAFLRSKKEPWLSEAFVSVADGTKAGFLTKTSSWSHKGKPKHDVPMTGQTWQGNIEFDESAGKDQVQISVPVMDGATPIGSLVAGLDIGKL